MRRRPVRRLFAIVFGLWFTIAVSGAAVAHRCPMHDGFQSSAPARTGHASHHADGHGSNAPGHGSHGHRCDCIRNCCSATSPAALEPYPARLALPLAAVFPLAPSDERVPPATLRFFPYFPTGPPSALTA